MQRRDFFKFIAVPLFACGCARPVKILTGNSDVATQPIIEDLGNSQNHSQILTEKKNINFDADYPDDHYCDHHKKLLVASLLTKFRAVEKYVGNGNFNLTGMDEFFHFAKYAPGLSALTKDEKNLVDELFHFNANDYGFHGRKVFTNLTDKIKKTDTIKIARSGHFLRKGKSTEMYSKIITDVGNSLILTSGIRGMAKQYHLFLEKAAISNFNLSRASRSIAPPGYSFHGEGDFDIGKVGFGLSNFTDDFAKTLEFKKLTDLGYVDIRYEEENNLGVRFEPWHIKV